MSHATKTTAAITAAIEPVLRSMRSDSPRVALPFARSMRDRSCAGQHFGAWAVEPKWFHGALVSVRNGTLQPVAVAFDEDDGDEDEPKYVVRDGVAIITIDGQMTKKGSSFGGCSTVRVRDALRTARDDVHVRAIVLHICTPGGTVAGTSDLAEEVVATRKKKPVYAYVADMCCSAGYWVASQCQTIYANTTALVGCIGTYVVLQDDTGLQEQIGIKWEVISTGEYKGLGADGKVTDKLRSDVQREIDELNAPFLAAVAAGRGKRISDMATVSDGRAYVSAQAQQLGLIDEIASLDAAIGAISDRSPFMNLDQFKAFAAEHPDAIAGFREEGRKAGVAEATKAERERAAAVREACAGRDSLALDIFLAGNDADDAALAVKAAADVEAKAKADAEAARAAAEAQSKQLAEVQEKLRLAEEKAAFLASGNRGVNAAGAQRQADEQKAQENKEAPDAETDPKAHAAWEWDTKPEVRAGFSKKENYVNWRTAQLKGRFRMNVPAPQPAK